MGFKNRVSDGPRGAIGANAGVHIGNDVWLISNVGVPSNGTSGTGAGFAGPGSKCTDATVTTAKDYINTNTKASPTWVVVGTQT